MHEPTYQERWAAIPLPLEAAKDHDGCRTTHAGLEARAIARAQRQTERRPDLDEIEPPKFEGALPTRLRISRYGARNWAVWLDGELIVVAVYKKGARTVAATLADLIEKVPTFP